MSGNAHRNDIPRHRRPQVRAHRLNSVDDARRAFAETQVAVDDIHEKRGGRVIAVRWRIAPHDALRSRAVLAQSAADVLRRVPNDSASLQNAPASRATFTFRLVVPKNAIDQRRAIRAAAVVVGISVPQREALDAQVVRPEVVIPLHTPDRAIAVDERHGRAVRGDDVQPGIAPVERSINARPHIDRVAVIGIVNCVLYADMRGIPSFAVTVFRRIGCIDIPWASDADSPGTAYGLFPKTVGNAALQNVLPAIRRRKRPEERAAPVGKPISALKRILHGIAVDVPGVRQRLAFGVERRHAEHRPGCRLHVEGHVRRRACAVDDRTLVFVRLNDD